MHNQRTSQSAIHPFRKFHGKTRAAIKVAAGTETRPSCLSATVTELPIPNFYRDHTRILSTKLAARYLGIFHRKHPIVNRSLPIFPPSRQRPRNGAGANGGREGTLRVQEAGETEQIGK